MFRIFYILISASCYCSYNIVGRVQETYKNWNPHSELKSEDKINYLENYH